jgi:O-antigen/teichoic acid export membrane protein
MSKRNPSRQVFKNTLSSYARDGVEAVLFLFLTPFLIRTLGAEEYGLWSLVWAIVSVLTLIDMGFATSVVKFIADARGREDRPAHQRAVGTFFWMYVLQAAVMLTLVAALALFLEHFVDLSPERTELASVALLLVGGATALGLPIGMFRGVLLGHQKQRVANYYKIGGSILYFATTLGVLSVYPDLRALAALNATFSVLLPLIAIFIHARATLPDVGLHPKYFERVELRSMFSFSVFFMLINVAAIIATRVDAFVVKWGLDLRAVAIYALAFRLSEKAGQICFQLARTLTPVVAELHGAGDQQQLRTVWLRGSKLAVAFAVPLLLGLALLAEPLIVSWTEPQFAASAPILQILIGAQFVSVVHSNSQNMMSMRGEQRTLAYIALAGQLLNLGLSFALVRPFGLVGVACATLVSVFLVEAVAVQTRVGRRESTPHLEFYRRTLLPSLLPAALMTFAMGVWNHFVPVDRLLEVALVEIAAVALFWGAFWWTGLDDEERAFVRARLARRRSQGRGP